jgi:methionyl-tRNA synthetase
MSKTLGNVLDPDPYLKLLGDDALRFFCLREVVFGEDGSINHESIAERTNANLANDLGNLLNRTLAMIEKDSNGEIPVEGEHNPELENTARVAHDGAVAAMRDFAPNRALDAIWLFVRVANRRVEEAKPWELRKEGKTRELHAFLYDQAQALHNLAILLNPFLPVLTQKMWEQLGLPGDIRDHRYHDGASWGTIDPGTKVRRGEPIVPRIDIPKFLDEVERLQAEKTREREGAGKPMAEIEEFKPVLTFDEFQKLDLRIAKVVECEPVKGTDKLLKLQIDLGSEKRQIVAGIAKVYKPEELVGKLIVVVANLAPVKLRGEESRGMLLATGTDETVTLLIPEKPAFPGDTVH